MSSQDTNLQEFILNELTEEKLKELDDIGQVPPNEIFFASEGVGEYYGGLPLGTILPLAIDIESPYLKHLNGECVGLYGIYKEFCDLIIQTYETDPTHAPICTIEEYLNDIKTYGQCGKFVINKTAQELVIEDCIVKASSIKLPTITEFIASNNGGDTIGLAELDEFKSHTHTHYVWAHTGATSSVGVQYGVNYANNGNIWAGGSGGEMRGNYNSNTGGDETRPKNIRYPYYIVVLTSQQPTTDLSITLLGPTLQIDTLYDKSSSNILLNWDQPNGIKGGVTITDKDFSKYDTLNIYCTFNDIPHIYTIDLTTKNTSDYLPVYPYAGGGTLTSLDDIIAGSSTAGIYFSFIGINENKTSLTHIHTGYTSGSNLTFRNNNTSYTIHKIEGIYKSVPRQTNTGNITTTASTLRRWID